MSGRIPSIPGVRLREVLPDARFVGTGDLRVTSCCADSRLCRPGDLFVALPGSRDDGHRHLDAAVARGAAAVLASRIPDSLGVPAAIVNDVPAAYGVLCQSLAGNPTQRMRVIGISGTDGKTTTSCLVASVLIQAGYSVGLLGTLGYTDGCEVEHAGWTTPPAPLVASWLRRMDANDCTHAVMEVSSHALEQSRVSGVEFDVTCLTNVTHDHLDYHGSVEAYRRAKARLFTHLRPQGVAVLNADDPYSIEMLAEHDGPVLTVGIEEAAEITATPVEQFSSEQTFLLSAGHQVIPVRTKLIGRHNISNCLMAAAVGLVYGIPLPTIVRGLEDVDVVPGRLDRIECGQPFSVFVDYAHTPQALSNVLRVLAELTVGRVICVFGAGGDRDRSKRPQMGRIVEQQADVAVLTNDNPRTEDPRAIMADVLFGCRFPGAVQVEPDRAAAISWALSQAEPGDTVLLAGKGHETRQVIGTQAIPFDDGEVARRCLYERATTHEFSPVGS